MLNSPSSPSPVPTCRFGAGLFYNPRPPELPPPYFHQLACSSCLVYVALAKQRCDLEYDATPVGLLPRRLPLKRSCVPPASEALHSNIEHTSIAPHLTAAISLEYEAFEALNISTGVSGTSTLEPSTTTPTVEDTQTSTRGGTIEYPQPIRIPDDLSHDNFFCNELLGGNKAHCSLWRDCCNAANRCCNETISTIDKGASSEGNI